MSDELLIRHCSPTLAGIKTGNLFSAEYKTASELVREIKSVNDRLSPKGLRLLPMRYVNGRALLYLYRPSYLRQDLTDRDTVRLLCEMGYRSFSPDKCIATLIERFRDSDRFPHEIGLFLSYPPEDVRGFIENNADNCKAVGAWKVYGDEDRAMQTFCRYKSCTDYYCRQWASGKTVEQLTVDI